MGEENKCKDCKYAYKRSDFSFKRYGSHSHPFECILEDSKYEMYKKVDDTCERWEQRENG